jgi:hypothetical protein
MANLIANLIDLPKIPDARGNLSFVEAHNHIPFEIQRVFYLYDVPGGESRAGHALRSCHQLIIAISGSFDVVLDDGNTKARHHMNRSYFGLHVPPQVWRVLDNFSSGAVCLVLASETYDSKGYFRDYQEYINEIASMKS